MLTDSELARREANKILLRPSGLRLRWTFSDLTTSDGHRITATFSCTATPLTAPVEQKMLEETFLSRATSVLADDVSTHFRPPLEESARRLISAQTVETALSEAGKTTWITRLRDSANAVAFACGLSLTPPWEAELDSPTLRLSQEEHRRGAEQSDRMTRAAALFRQFQEIRTATPDLTPGQVLQRIGSADQPEMLRSLLLASAKQSDARPLWAVAGQYLVKITPAQDGASIPIPQLIDLPTTLGPLRSVNSAPDGKLLIGARTGVFYLDPAHPEQAQPCVDPQTNSNLGFNAALLANGLIWATHGEAGVVAWNIENHSAPSIRRPIQTPRNLVRIDEHRIAFTSGKNLLTLTPDSPPAALATTAQSDILAVIADDHYLAIVHEDGLLIRLHRQTLEILDQTRRTGPLTAAGPLPWLGSRRLLLATEDGPLHCLGFDDDLITQYTSPYRGLRLTAASPLTAAALSPDRQRIILWPTWDGRKPVAELHIAGLAKHRVADIEFA